MDFPLHTSLHDLALARSSLALVGLALLLTWETFAPFFASGSAQQRGIHGSRNLILGALNALMIAFAFAGLWYAVSRWSTTHRLLVVLRLVVDPAAGLRHPQLDAVVLEQRVCVPKTSSTSCDQTVFIDRATGAGLPSDAVPAEIDRLG